MMSMLTAKGTKLFSLKAFRMRLLILPRGVIPPAAGGAFKLKKFSHLFVPIVLPKFFVQTNKQLYQLLIL